MTQIINVALPAIFNEHLPHRNISAMVWDW